ncbi:mediator-associated protein 1 [Quillaja saponaria]|uniref:Mediator-associated protein 1 n=1 Tax=Quillaja saponaria TaxID=32244 RepID=A0AAD7PBZ7_QUISA|nr:mediator-associated protein 1 [Quillaja saponaria]
MTMGPKRASSLDYPVAAEPCEEDVASSQELSSNELPPRKVTPSNKCRAKTPSSESRSESEPESKSESDSESEFDQPDRAVMPKSSEKSIQENVKTKSLKKSKAWANKRPHDDNLTTTDSKRAKTKSSEVAPDVILSRLMNEYKNNPKRFFAGQTSCGMEKLKPKPKPKPKPKSNGAKVWNVSKAISEEVDKWLGLGLKEMILMRGTGTGTVLAEHVSKEGLEMVGEAERTQLARRWKELGVAEMELFRKRMELIRDQLKLISEAYK